jgi:hypothetical protein
VEYATKIGMGIVLMDGSGLKVLDCISGDHLLKHRSQRDYERSTMFDLFKRDVQVKCYDLDELAKLLNWYRAQRFSHMAETQYPVTAVITGILNEQQAVKYFIVRIPFTDYKKLRDKFIESEAFDPILQQRSFSEVLGRKF